MMDILFEKEEFQSGPTDNSVASATIITQPKILEDDKKNKKDIEKTKKKKDNKTAPVPEWVKRRKGK